MNQQIFELGGEDHPYGLERIPMNMIERVTKQATTITIHYVSGQKSTVPLSVPGTQQLWDAYKPHESMKIWDKQNLPNKPVVIRDVNGNIIYPPEQSEQGNES